MHQDILIFFNRQIDVLPLYEKMEKLILQKIPNVKITVTKNDSNRRYKYESCVFWRFQYLGI